MNSYTTAVPATVMTFPTFLAEQSAESEPDSQSAAASWGAPIHVYTRAQAIVDGVLIDAQIGDLREVTRQHFGDMPVAMTAALFALIEKAVNNPKHLNDWRGVWHDICWMNRMTGRFVTPPGTYPSTRLFKVIITGVGRRKLHTLKLVQGYDDDGGLAATFMLPDED